LGHWLPEVNGTSRSRADLSGEIRVAVVVENEILRRGLAASLAEDPGLVVVASRADGSAGVDADVAVVSGEAVEVNVFPCPLVVCIDGFRRPPTVADGNEVVGVLHRATLTSAQLRATVHAAAAGLLISGHELNGLQPQLDERSTLIVELMADGHSTREIAARLSYSERTIKKLIMGLQHNFEARSRAQVVAQAIRKGLI